MSIDTYLFPNTNIKYLGQNELSPGAINPDFALFYGRLRNVYITYTYVTTTIVKRIKKSII